VIGQVLNDRYRVESQIGKGGMGSVYLGFHITIGRRVAIKFLHTEYAENEELVVRFFREAQAAAAIEHKSIIEVLDMGVSDNDEPYIVMEYLEGESLGDLLKREGRIDFSAACAILEPVLKALSAAHKKGIIHRDLKPENIFLVRDDETDRVLIKLIDFGISKILDMNEEQALTRAGALLGTPFYMSPEQAVGSLDVDHRTDIFSMGIILFEMLTGELPFEGKTTRKVILSILTDEPRKGSDVVEDFPAEAQKILDKSLRRDPDDRFENTNAFLDALKRIREFDSRHTRLSRYASGVVNPRCAVGDLGVVSESKGGKRAPAEVLSALSKNSPPSDWIRNTTSSRVSQKKNKTWVIAVIGALLLAVAGVGLFVSLSKKAPTPSPPSERKAVEGVLVNGSSKQPFEPKETRPQEKPPSKSAPPSAVKISIFGVPNTAVIYVDEQKMISNPFLLPYSEQAVSIRITADGFETETLQVKPTSDTNLHTDLSKALTEAEPEPKESTPDQIKKAPVKKDTKDDYRKGKRGVEVGEKFI
jgi:serine/threonine protein kinase